jgi:hypothetical protein
VTLSKLQKYVEQQGGYDLEERGGDVTLSFVPAFPEALEKGWEDNPPPRVIMHGTIRQDKIAFNKVEIEQDNHIVEKEMEIAEFTYRSWLQYIEDNY